MIYFYLCCLLIFLIFFNIDVKEGLTKNKSKDKDDNDDNDDNVNVNDCGGVDSLNAKLQTANSMMDKIIKQGNELNSMLSSDSDSGSLGKHKKKGRRHKKTK